MASTAGPWSPMAEAGAPPAMEGPPPPTEETKAPPTLTGFVLRLYNMVNGAPDDVVAWVPSGEAFRIADLPRLESETLPQYFRHSRFQSLVRQLNFYNFRKINRERTFWVYYHPLFHRDKADDMHKLRRRTCPGFDGRRNKPGTAGGSTRPSSPVNSVGEGIAWSSEHNQVVRVPKGQGGQGEAPTGVAPASPEGIKVSRSPSPTGPDHLPNNQANVLPPGSYVGPNLKSIVSEEERSPLGRREGSAFAPVPSPSNDPLMEAQKNLSRTVSAVGDDLRAKDVAAPDGVAPPPDPLREAEEAAVDQLNHRLEAPEPPPAEKVFTKKVRKAKIWTDNETDETGDANDVTARRKTAREQLRERQDHRLAVEEVSRRLNGILEDYAASIAATKPKARSKSRGRLGSGAAAGQAKAGRSGGGGARGTGPSPCAFGFDKPQDHYYGAGKCDLFTYDVQEGQIVDGGAGPPGSPVRKRLPRSPASVAPPSTRPDVNRSLVQACADGRLLPSSSSSVTVTERTLASSVLSLCLRVHPRDPALSSKVAAHLKKGPMLRREFDLYRRALTPHHETAGRGGGGEEDAGREWRTFAANLLRRTVTTAEGGGRRFRLVDADEEALERCVACWFREF